VFTVAAAFFVAELGDKTQLMTVSIAADPSAALRTLERVVPGLQAPAAGAVGTMVGVWLGSTLGMLLADGVALLIGFLLGARLPERLIRRFAAVVFVLFGVVTLVSAFV
jgi:putative Ca2+/H+ antiporter (TMEM165/GDT1 family)